MDDFFLLTGKLLAVICVSFAIGGLLMFTLNFYGNYVWQKCLAIYRIESMRYYMGLAEKRGRLGIRRESQQDLDDVEGDL